MIENGVALVKLETNLRFLVKIFIYFYFNSLRLAFISNAVKLFKEKVNAL